MRNLRKIAVFCALAFAAASLAGCGKKKKDDDDDDEEVLIAPVASGHVRVPGTSGRFNVGIIDDGFDLNQPLFDGRVLADYDIACDTAGDAAPASADQDTKDYLISEYAKPENTCRLEPGVTFEYSNDLLALENRRDVWNSEIRDKAVNLNTSDAIEFRTVLGGYDRSLLYHGTNTASLILYANPDVRLVVFRMNLNGASSLSLADASCPEQADIDLWVDAHQDPDVIAAYAATPLSDFDRGIEDVSATYGLNVFNASYGRIPREIQERLLVSEGCPAVDLKAYYSTQAALDLKRFEARAAQMPRMTAALTVQASGNDGVTVDSGADSIDCMTGTNTVLVGSHDIGGKLSEFSNRGACVPYTMLGEKVVVGAPRQFLDVADGTSFAAPLTVRYLSLVSDNGDSARTLKARLDAQKDDRGFLADATFPVELAYSNATPIGAFQLTESMKKDPRWVKARQDLLRRLLPLHRAAARK